MSSLSPVPELNIQNKQSLKIHVVEAGKEFDLVMVFWVSPSRPEEWACGCGGGHGVEPRFVLFALQELLVLLPHMALELQFVGDGLPPESDQQHFTLQRVRVESLSPCPSPQSPDLVPLLSSWLGCALLIPAFSPLSYLTHFPAPSLPLASLPLLTLQDGPEVSVRPCSGVSARLSSGTKEKGVRRDLQIKVSARPYHLLQGPKPDLVIGKSRGWERGEGARRPWKLASLCSPSLRRI